MTPDPIAPLPPSNQRLKAMIKPIIRFAAVYAIFAFLMSTFLGSFEKPDPSTEALVPFFYAMYFFIGLPIDIAIYFASGFMTMMVINQYLDHKPQTSFRILFFIGLFTSLGMTLLLSGFLTPFSFFEWLTVLALLPGSLVFSYYLNRKLQEYLIHFKPVSSEEKDCFFYKS